MSHEIAKFRDEVARAEREGRSGPSQSAIEKFMRVYGSNFIKAFDDLEKARQLLDIGSVSQAVSYARHAAVALRDPGIENDRGRDPMAIVTEILHIFPAKRRENFQGLYVYDEDCIVEIQTRLRISRSDALELLRRHFEEPQGPALPAPEEERVEEIADAEVELLPEGSHDEPSSSNS